MPHKDRSAYLAYLEGYRAQHRPAPKPLPQPDPELPPMGMLIYQDDGTGIQCHVCGQFLGRLPGHIRLHGLNADSYKERFGLARTASLLSPRCAELQRQAAIARDQGAQGWLEPHPRQKGSEGRLQSRLRNREAALTIDLGHRRPRKRATQ